MGNIVSYFRAKPESAAAVELLKVSEVPVDTANTVPVDTVSVKRETVDEKLTTDNVVEEKELEVVEEAKEINLPVLDDDFEVNLLKQIISEVIQEEKVSDSNQTFNTPEENIEKGSIATEEVNQEPAPATPFVENVSSLKDDNDTSIIANKELTLEALKMFNDEPSTETERCESDVEVIGSIDEQADPEVTDGKPMPTQETVDPVDVELIESIQDAEPSKPASPGPEEVESRPEPVKDEVEIIDLPIQSDPTNEKQAIVELPEEQTIEIAEDVPVEVDSAKPVRMPTPEKLVERIEDVDGIEVISSIQDIESVRVPTPEIAHEEVSESIEDVDGVEVITSITDIKSAEFVRVPTPEIANEEISESIKDVDGVEVISSIKDIESVRVPTPEIVHEQIYEAVENVPSVEVIGSIQDIEPAETVRSPSPEKASAVDSKIVKDSLNESIKESDILKPEPNKVELDVEELELEEEQTSETVPEQTSETVPEQTSETVSEQTSETVTEQTPETVPEQTSETVTEQTSIQETSSEPTEAVPEVEMIGSIQDSDSELVNLENTEAVKIPSSEIVKEQTTEHTTYEPIESTKTLSHTSETIVYDDEAEDQNLKGVKSSDDSVNDRDVIKEDTNEDNNKEVEDMQTVSGGAKGVKDLLDDSSNSDEEY